VLRRCRTARSLWCLLVDFGAPFVTVSKGHCRNDSICSLVSANRWNYKNSFSESLKLCSNRWNYSQIAETNFAETNFAESKKWQKLKISKNWRTSTNFPAKNTRTHVFGSFYGNSQVRGHSRHGVTASGGRERVRQANNGGLGLHAINRTYQIWKISSCHLGALIMCQSHCSSKKSQYSYLNTM
jgi:hypothetical protein